MGYDYHGQESHIKKVREINLKEYFEVIKRRYWVVILITLITTGAGFAYSHFTNNNFVPLYETSTRMIIVPGENDMNTLMVMIKDPIVMGRVKEELGLTRSTDEISNQISVARIDESRVVSITVTDSDPNLAANIATSTAVAFKNEIVKILGFENVQLLSEAQVNPTPINESGGNKTIVIAFIFGLVTGIGLVFILDSLDDKVRHEEDLEKILGVPVLGVISNMNRKRMTFRRKKRREPNVRGETVDAK